MSEHILMLQHQLKRAEEAVEDHRQQGIRLADIEKRLRILLAEEISGTHPGDIVVAQGRLWKVVNVIPGGAKPTLEVYREVLGGWDGMLISLHTWEKV